jgi:HEAT repeat protein
VGTVENRRSAAIGKSVKETSQIDTTSARPLVHGLQDPNPLVREEAVDALSDFRDDPAVLQWLQYVSQNDADPQVRREAFESLAND